MTRMQVLGWAIGISLLFGYEPMAAAKSWRRLQGQNQLPKVINGVTFRDGIEVAFEAKSAA